MNANNRVILEISGRIARIILNSKPENRLTVRDLNELFFFIDKIEKDRKVEIVLVQSRVDGYFCAGIEPDERKKLSAGEICKAGQLFFVHLSSLSRPTISVVRGKILGDGIMFVLATDIAIASENSSFQITEPRMKALTAWGTSQWLPRQIGKNRALELALTGREIGAQKCLEIGLFNMISKEDSLEQEVDLLMTDILKNGPTVNKYVKKAILEGIDMNLKEALQLEYHYNYICTAESSEASSKSTADGKS